MYKTKAATFERLKRDAMKNLVEKLRQMLFPIIRNKLNLMILTLRSNFLPSRFRLSFKSELSQNLNHSLPPQYQLYICASLIKNKLENLHIHLTLVLEPFKIVKFIYY